MNHTIEGSKKYEVVCMGWVEDLDKLEKNEKGFTAGKSARRDGVESNISNIQEIQVGKVTEGELFENGILKSKNGKQNSKFNADKFKIVKEYNTIRVTDHAIMMKSKNIGLSK